MLIKVVHFFPQHYSHFGVFPKEKTAMLATPIDQLLTYGAETRTMNTRQFFSAFLNEYPVSIRRLDRGTDWFDAPSNHVFGRLRESDLLIQW